MLFWKQQVKHQKMLLPRFYHSLKEIENITQIIAKTHWQPVSFRIDFKIVLLFLKTLNGQAPAYICDLLTQYEYDCCLGSSS